MKKNKPLIYAIIPARSGSKGISNKNIKLLNSKPLIAYSISFAKALNVDKIICSTDSHKYAQIALKYGAEVPFLRSEKASSDQAMEEDILLDLYEKFDQHSIPYPDLFVWLRPTFVFRDLKTIQKCIQLLLSSKQYSSARTICETEGRLYKLENNEIIIPQFNDYGKSMIRRQDIGKFYKVFSTDIFRGKPKNCNPDFLGRNVFGIEIPKLCGFDIDDKADFNIIEMIIKTRPDARKYLL
jgi:CMP-N-acetylneuraminic acid synthetase